VQLWRSEDELDFISILHLTGAQFFAYVGIMWWASWYPGAEAGGGGFIAQRMMSTKDEKNAVFATMWYVTAHYCLRPWPWILTALVSHLLYPELDEPRQGFVLVMREVLPEGARGLLFAAFLSAFMSTISTQLNWGASYIVNDFLKGFVFKNRNEATYVYFSRLTTILIACVSIGVAFMLDSITQALQLVISASAGLGSVLIMRWYWWRISAYSELAALLTPLGLSIVNGCLQVGTSCQFFMNSKTSF
jgi:Na+/proline symporter